MSAKLDGLTDVAWLVSARNEIQSLMFRLERRWDKLDANTRQFALGAAFSLWRAVFLIYDDDTDRPLEIPESDAKSFLNRVIVTNTIGFGDDRTYRRWSGGYYVNNAMYRISELIDGRRARSFEGPRKLREAWNEAFERLKKIVDDGPTGTI
jgi:hypothetical protein